VVKAGVVSAIVVAVETAEALVVIAAIAETKTQVSL
jgi:hypothetical protein